MDRDAARDAAGVSRALGRISGGLRKAAGFSASRRRARHKKLVRDELCVFNSLPIVIYPSFAHFAHAAVPRVLKKRETEFLSVHSQFQDLRSSGFRGRGSCF